MGLKVGFRSTRYFSFRGFFRVREVGYFWGGVGGVEGGVEHPADAAESGLLTLIFLS